MAEQLKTMAELEQLLRDEVVAYGGAKKWCRKKSVHMDRALHMVENGTAATLDRVLDALGYEKVTRYAPRQ